MSPRAPARAARRVLPHAFPVRAPMQYLLLSFILILSPPDTPLPDLSVRLPVHPPVRLAVRFPMRFPVRVPMQYLL